MSVITGRGTTRADPRGPTAPRWKVPELCREFVEQLVARGRAIAARDGQRSDVPGVEWDAIQRAGDGARSLEQATGSVVLAGFLAARRQSRGVDELLGPLDTAGPMPPAVVVSNDPSTEGWGEGPTVSRRLDHRVPVEAAVPVASATFDGTADYRLHVAPPESQPIEIPAGQTATALSARFTLFTWVRNFGAILLLFVAWQLWGTSISQHHAQDQLQSAFEASVREHHAAPAEASGPSLIPATQAVASPAEGSLVARLQVPAIGLDEYVVSGTAEADLAKGPGHYIGSAMPGQAGNVAIAGHRTTNGAPFNRIGQLTVGNQILLTTLTGERLTYVVSQSPAAVPPIDVAVLNDFGDNRITLTTCNPEFSASQRLIVVGTLKQPNAPKPTRAKPIAYHIVDPATASWDWSSLPAVVLAAGALLLLGLSNRWFTAWFGRSGRWMILVPVWGAGLYLLFGTLTRFLPASI